MRRRSAPERKILPDPIKKSQVIARFVNTVMKHGKKSLAEKIVYGALDKALKQLFDKKGPKIEGLSPKSSITDVLTLALEKLRPSVEVKSRRVGGATYQIPCEVSPKRAMALAMRWLLQAARKRSEKGMIQRLCAEICDVFLGRGAAIKTKQDRHKMAEANKAFAHYS
jgi:small subunit ribosomal protein S7